MSQGGSSRKGSGGGGGGITTIDGNSGFVTGSTVYFLANPGSGISASFVGDDASTMTLNISAIGSSLAVNRIVYNTPGSFTYTPSANIVSVLVQVLGAGGAGGGTLPGTGTTIQAGGGGAGGGYAEALLSPSDIGVSQTVIVGNKGVGGSAIAGTNGQDSSFGILLVGGGGQGGAAGIVSGSFTIGGSPGINSSTVPNSFLMFGQFGGFSGPNATSPTIPPYAFTGYGGGNIFASSPGPDQWCPDVGTLAINGFPADDFGMGGAGSLVALLNLAPSGGGDGFSGLVIITEYISASSGVIVENWIVVTVNTTMSPNTGYIANSLSVINLTMPSVAPVGSIIEVCSINGSGGWSVILNGGQSIIYNTTTATTSITSTNSSDTLRMVCTVANTQFIVLSGDGNPTII